MQFILLTNQQLVSVLLRISCGGSKAGRLESSEISFIYMTSGCWLSAMTLPGAFC